MPSPLSAASEHLCVLVHGLWGKPDHLAYLAASLRETFLDRLHVLVVARNAGSQTYDGIETGGERITQEIEEELERLAHNGHAIRKISIVGYSLGGLISRYAIGLMYHKGWFETIEPVNFTTFATPHLGVRTPLLGVWNRMWNVLGARMLSETGRQLFTVDSFRNTGRPLLANLADPDGVFVKGLTRFKHRSLYCNVVNDRSVVYYTAAISLIDPFVDLEKVSINYLDGYGDVILDPNSPVTPKNKKDDDRTTFCARLADRSYSMMTRLPLVLFLAVFVPVAMALFSMSSVVQSIRSSRRMRLHAEGKSGVDTGSYTIPLLVNEMRREAEEIFEGLNHGQDYLPSGSEETTAPAKHIPGTATTVCPAITFDGQLDAVESGESEGEAAHCSDKTNSTFPTLALTPAQFSMIQALDAVGFRKYQVHIHKHRHSHAAIIMRTLNKRSFDEGKLVVQHWLDQFEV